MQSSYRGAGTFPTHLQQETGKYVAYFPGAALALLFLLYLEQSDVDEILTLPHLQKIWSGQYTFRVSTISLFEYTHSLDIEAA